jgi:hypothetical protein
MRIHSSFDGIATSVKSLPPQTALTVVMRVSDAVHWPSAITIHVTSGIFQRGRIGAVPGRVGGRSPRKDEHSE